MSDPPHSLRSLQDFRILTMAGASHQASSCCRRNEYTPRKEEMCSS